MQHKMLASFQVFIQGSNNISYRQISRALNTPSSTAADYCKRFEITNYKIDEFLTLDEDEKILHKNVSDLFQKIGRFDIITFVDRLSVLKLDPLIKQALIDEQITYSQAKVLKSKLKNDSEITKILEVLKNKKLSVNELKVYIDNLKKSSAKDEPINKNIFDNVNFYSKKLSKKVYSKLSNEDKFYIDSKLKDIEKLYLEINSKIKE